MRAALLLALWSTTALADGDSSEEASRKILQAAEFHIQELRRLHATDALLEVQLRIARKLQECQQTGYPCLGAEPLPPSTEGTSPSPAPARAPDLPQLVGVYQGRARLRLDGGRHVEAQAGQRLGPWRILSVEVDSIEMTDPEGMRFRIPLQKPAP